MPSFKIGADLPPSWYLTVAMPGEEGNVVVKDMENECSEQELEAGDEGGAGCVFETGESDLGAELVKRPVTG